jgi:hypothetical protein
LTGVYAPDGSYNITILNSEDLAALVAAAESTDPVPVYLPILTPYRNTDVDQSEDAVKATPGKIYFIHAMNMAAEPRYLKFYDATVASVEVGTTVPVLEFPLSTLETTDGQGFCLAIPNGIDFSTAITIAATTGLGSLDAGAPGADEVVVNLGYI